VAFLTSLFKKDFVNTYRMLGMFENGGRGSFALCRYKPLVFVPSIKLSVAALFSRRCGIHCLKCRFSINYEVISTSAKTFTYFSDNFFIAIFRWSFL